MLAAACLCIVFTRTSNLTEQGRRSVLICFVVAVCLAVCFVLVHCVKIVLMLSRSVVPAHCCCCGLCFLSSFRLLPPFCVCTVCAFINAQSLVGCHVWGELGVGRRRGRRRRRRIGSEKAGRVSLCACACVCVRVFVCVCLCTVQRTCGIGYCVPSGAFSRSISIISPHFAVPSFHTPL